MLTLILLKLENNFWENRETETDSQVTDLVFTYTFQSERLSQAQPGPNVKTRVILRSGFYSEWQVHLRMPILIWVLHMRCDVISLMQECNDGILIHCDFATSISKVRLWLPSG